MMRKILMHLLASVPDTMQLGEFPSVSARMKQVSCPSPAGPPGLLMGPQNRSEVCVMNVPDGKYYVIFIS